MPRLQRLKTVVVLHTTAAHEMLLAALVKAYSGENVVCIELDPLVTKDIVTTLRTIRCHTLHMHALVLAGGHWRRGAFALKRECAMLGCEELYLYDAAEYAYMYPSAFAPYSDIAPQVGPLAFGSFICDRLLTTSTGDRRADRSVFGAFRTQFQSTLARLDRNYFGEASTDTEMLLVGLRAPGGHMTLERLVRFFRCDSALASEVALSMALNASSLMDLARQRARDNMHLEQIKTGSYACVTVASELVVATHLLMHQHNPTVLLTIVYNTELAGGNNIVWSLMSHSSKYDAAAVMADLDSPTGYMSSSKIAFGRAPIKTGLPWIGRQ
jgi:hypothetical protein